MGQFILKTTCFLYLLFLINAQGNRLMPFGWENPDFFKKLSNFNRDYADRVNTVFFGSSRTYRHVNVALFDSLNASRQIETSSYNLATSAVHFNELNYLYPCFFRDSVILDQLDYMFLELDDEIFIPKEYLYTTRLSYYITANTIIRILKLILSSHASSGEKLVQIYYHLSSMMRHHMYMGQGEERIKAVLYKSPRRQSHELTGGFKPAFTTSEEFRKSEQLQKRRAAFLMDTHVVHRAFAQIDSLHRNQSRINQYNPMIYDSYLQFIQMLKGKGVYIICVLPMRRTISADLIGLANALPKEHVIDMSSHPDIHLLKSARYWFDPGHLNRDGAKIYTELLSDAFQKIKNQE